MKLTVNIYWHPLITWLDSVGQRSRLRKHLYRGGIRSRVSGIMVVLPLGAFPPNLQCLLATIPCVGCEQVRGTKMVQISITINLICIGVYCSFRSPHLALIGEIWHSTKYIGPLFYATFSRKRETVGIVALKVAY